MANARDLLKKHLPKVQKAVGVRVFCFSGNKDTYTISNAEIRDEMVDILGTGDDNDQPTHVRELEPVLWFELSAVYKPKKYDVCIVDDKEGYQITSVHHQEGILYRAEATRLRADEIITFNIPEFK